MELVLNGERKMNIILSFDTCHVATFFDHVFVLPYVYRAKALGGLEIEPHGGAKLGQNQIIFLASTRFDQEARTWVPGKEYGAVTFFTYWQFRVLDLNVPRTAKELVERLYSRCHDGGQDPQIRALRPIDDSDLKLLLG
ncbi:hypothetical protein M407DRAFT_241194 [Tulasnella calospora MUT 4182]|uniref:Uncharacterized protein n=1 Tax=Tulasnella calospora MUT 4182 TaxID=1051891 RepID=A0A0C3LG35_9AGAM|nr:hypothetical protein M407DRAFT_241194 [Tulasnella calospora MUT 4182]